MKFLRATMGKTRRDRIRNAHIREELRMDIHKEDIQNQIEGKTEMVQACQKNG
jgi:hypothetical protein